MKKIKVFGKAQIVLAVMVVALGAAVWLNMKYSTSLSGTNQKYLGQAEYVNNSSDGEAVETSAPAQDYFTSARDERTKVRAAAEDELTETIKNAGGNTETVKAAVDAAAVIEARSTAEANIETILKAKGMPEVLAVIGDSDVNVVIRGDSLTAEQTLQIQDAAVSQSGYTMDKIKIVTVK